MSRLQQALAAFADADTAAWPGLPAGTVLADLQGMPADTDDGDTDGDADAGGALAAFAAALEDDDRRPGEAGDPPQLVQWLPVEAPRYAGGLRLWIDGADVLAVEGVHPLDAAGAFLPAPDLGTPEETCDAQLGPLLLAGGERVYAARGLAVRLNPENGLLLSLVGFAPTTAQYYLARLRPLPEPFRPLLARQGVTA